MMTRKKGNIHETVNTLYVTMVLLTTNRFYWAGRMTFPSYVCSSQIWRLTKNIILWHVFLKISYLNSIRCWYMKLKTEKSLRVHTIDHKITSIELMTRALMFIRQEVATSIDSLTRNIFFFVASCLYQLNTCPIMVFIVSNCIMSKVVHIVDTLNRLSRFSRYSRFISFPGYPSTSWLMILHMST